MDDPLSEDHDTPWCPAWCTLSRPVLFLVTGTLLDLLPLLHPFPRLVGNPGGEYQFSRASGNRRWPIWKPITEVRDVLLSGGDPLTLSDESCDWLLGRLRAHPPYRIFAHRHQDAGG